MNSSTFTKLIYVAIVLTVGVSLVRRFADPVSMDNPMLTAENGAYLTYDSATGVGTFKPSTEPARVTVEVSKDKGIAPIITVTLSEKQATASLEDGSERALLAAQALQGAP